ncbi:MAG: IS21 family transposase [Tissierellia bacterium]|nr:IS21 family transposase [Tissierellia bacterium]
MIIEVEIYKVIRKLTTEGVSQRQIAKKLGISRQTVKKYGDGDTVPGNRKEYERPASVVTPDILAFIESCFEADALENLPKQKHTAKRIYERLVTEKEFKGAESTIRTAVRSLRSAQTVPSQAMMPLSYAPGEALQIDWGVATVYLEGQKTKVNVFCARLCYSCDIFVTSYKAANEESFLEAQQLAFEYFGGVPRRVIFDNAKVAVKEGFGLYAKPQARYLSFSAHYAFELDFCNPSKGNEKGLVENLVGYSRRNFLVPVVHAANIEYLNEHLLSSCLTYRKNHKVQGRNQTVLEMSTQEMGFLHTIPKFQFDTSRTIVAKTDSFSTVRFDKNNYSVPTRYLMQDVTVKGRGNTVVLWDKNTQIASFERSYASGNTSYKLEHYIDLLERKPRSVRNARPVKESVAEELLQWGKLLPDGNKEMVKLLRLCVDHGQEKILSIKHLIPGGVVPTVDLVRSYLIPPAATPMHPLKNEMEVDHVDLTIYERKYGVAVNK